MRVNSTESSVRENNLQIVWEYSKEEKGLNISKTIIVSSEKCF